MGYIKIERLKYEGKNYYYESPKLRSGLNIFLGDNGNGKSTFTYLLYYALGNEVKYLNNSTEESILEIINDKENYVELDVIINNKEFNIKRGIGKNDISVKNKENQQVDVFSIYRQGYIYQNNNRTFSDWILDRLKINIAEIEQYNTSHKVNFDDLMRLIYMDQKTESGLIYKNLDTNNLFKNGIILKKTIFEILIDKFYPKYYESYFKIKELKRSKTDKISCINSIKEIIKHYKNNFSKNDLDNIDTKIDKLKIKLEMLYKERLNLQEKRNDYQVISKQIKEIENKISSLVKEKTDKINYEKSLYKNLSNSYKAKEKVENDIEYLTKILYTSKKIKLFELEECPFCFGKISIEKGKCICGSSEPLNFEKFIYSDEEYENILKSKIKLLKTIKETIQFCKDEIEFNSNNIKNINVKIKQENKKLKNIISGCQFTINIEVINNIENKIFEIKSNLKNLEIISGKINELKSEKNQLNDIEKRIKKEQIKFEKFAEQKEEMLANNIDQFEKIYENYLKEIYKEQDNKIKKVHLNKSYMPIINNGEYKETSFEVPKRLFYYLTFLKLSMEKDIAFPRFLLIDTIKDKGFKRKKIIKCYEFIEELSCGRNQIILTSGYEEFDEKFDDYVVERLTDNNKLLKKRTIEI